MQAMLPIRGRKSERGGSVVPVARLLLVVAAVCLALGPLLARRRQHAPPPPPLGPEAAGHEQAVAACMQRQYTVVVSSYNRREALLHGILPHWHTCPHIRDVHVVWHNTGRPFDDERAAGAAFPKLTLRAHPENRLTRRFEPPPRLRTDAVFSADDDLGIDCRLMTAAFQLWCLREAANASSLVGFEPRLFDFVSQNASTGLGYSWDASCAGNCTYNTLWASKGAFLHRRWYDAFSSPPYEPLRAAVDASITGEDMLMSAVLAAHRVPAVAVHAGPDLEEAFAMPAAAQLHKHASLGHRTHGKRAGIRQRIAQAFAGQLEMLPTSDWYLVAASGQLSRQSKPCASQKMRCTH
jgi:hypothetical protein